MKILNDAIRYAVFHRLIDPVDANHAYNRLANHFGLETPVGPDFDTNIPLLTLEALKDGVSETARRLGRIPEDAAAAETFFAAAMDFVLMSPSELQRRFESLEKQSPQDATDELYRIAHAGGYIQAAHIAKNKTFSVPTDFGVFDLTINLSKPEKDPRDIARQKDAESTGYPACLLCKETVGFRGKADMPSRANHRIVQIVVNDETFYLQYSPYVYYNEHAILLHEDHIPMDVGRHTFYRLFDFIDRFPHYFMGSNAGIPIVGGSILSHEHYQGGHARFPIDTAQATERRTYDGIIFERLHWPMSVIRLTSKRRQPLITAAASLLDLWQAYTNEAIDVIAETTTRHNAVTPILRKDNDTYVLHVCLRNNRTNDAYPDGIFHIRPEHWHIKKENIGLIEVMGLAILPGRLDGELNIIGDIIQTDKALPENLKPYASWVATLKKRYDGRSIQRFLETETGQVFVDVLKNCAVFKHDARGEQCFSAFFNRYVDAVEKKRDRRIEGVHEIMT